MATGQFSVVRMFAPLHEVSQETDRSRSGVKAVWAFSFINNSEIHQPLCGSFEKSFVSAIFSTDYTSYLS